MDDADVAAVHISASVTIFRGVEVGGGGDDKRQRQISLYVVPLPVFLLQAKMKMYCVREKPLF